jgi:hypothetical protein
MFNSENSSGSDHLDEGLYQGNGLSTPLVVSPALNQSTARTDLFTPMDTAGRSNPPLPPFLSQQDETHLMPERAEYSIQPPHIETSAKSDSFTQQPPNSKVSRPVTHKSDFTVADVFETVAQLCRQLDQLGLRVATDIQQLQLHQEHEKQVGGLISQQLSSLSQV